MEAKRFVVFSDSPGDGATTPTVFGAITWESFILQAAYRCRIQRV
jgi:hypothetical protein